MLARRSVVDPTRTCLCGEGEIRTPATLSGRPVFETGAFNRSATSPGGTKGYRCRRVRSNGVAVHRGMRRGIAAGGVSGEDCAMRVLVVRHGIAEESAKGGGGD